MKRQKSFVENIFIALAIDAIDLAMFFVSFGQSMGWNIIITFVQVYFAEKNLPRGIAAIGHGLNFMELAPLLPAEIDQFIPGYTIAVILDRIFPNFGLTIVEAMSLGSTRASRRKRS